MNTDSQMPPMDGVPPNMNVPPMDGVPPPMENTVPPTNALSIYGQDAGVEDFPVLKAFQQYIDAEQSKSRKRMIMLSMFFGVLMTILVAVFVFLLGQMNHDKQSANDKLVEFLMRERERTLTAPPAAAPVQAPAANPANDAALKAVTDTLAALQKQIADDRAATHKRELEEAREAARRAAEPKGKSAAQIELDRINQEKIEKMKKANALLQAERKKIEAEKAKLKAEKIEAYRRQHYPEFYEPAKPSPALTPVKPKPVTTLKMDRPKPARPTTGTQEKKDSADATKSATGKTPSPSTETSLLNKNDEPIEYFSEDATEYQLDDGDDVNVSIPMN